ncbi:MAG: hypothetical protein ABIJ61_08175 [bacterium]
MKRITSLLLIAIFFQFGYGWSVESIVGPSFDRLIASQHGELQQKLETLLPESAGYVITGPLSPDFAYDPQLLPLYEAVRVICPDLQSCDKAVAALRTAADLKLISTYPDTAGLGDAATGWRGWRAEIGWQGDTSWLCVNTINQTRLLIWMEAAREQGWVTYEIESRRQYAAAVSQYLAAIDSGRVEAIPPRALEYRLDSDFDIYAPIPDAVISGYQKYNDYLNQFRAINTEFANGIVAFIPSEKTLEQIIANAPREAFANKEGIRLQQECREFAARGKDLRLLQNLTAAGFDTLRTGEYFFAVSAAGRIRFGREFPPAETAPPEAAAANAPHTDQALLFPGEAVLTAGTFYIDDRQPSKLIKVTTGSECYFYSNIQSSIYEDVAMRSDYYLLTLGHFFAALTELGIPYHDVLISKF